MYVITIIGGAKQGKTPFIKAYCNKKNVLIFDVQNEYGKQTKYVGQTPYGLTEDNKQPRSRYVGLEEKEFITLCSNKKNTICVFEEATMFFQGAIDKNMRRLLFGKAHTKNIYVLVFHSINSLPPRIMEATDFVVLFRTNDERDTVERKYKKLLPAFDRLQQAKTGQHIKIKMI